MREAGLAPWSADGTATRQAWIAALADDGVFEGVRAARGIADWRIEADRILATLAPSGHVATRAATDSHRSDR